MAAQQDLASLVIGLRADVATLQSDLGKASALNSKYAKDASDTWTASAANIGKALGAAVVSFAGIGVALAKQSIDAADGLNKLSQKVGVTVESLSALNVQARLSDVGIDQLQGGLAKLTRNAADAASGSKQQAAAFQAMGVSLKDANGNLRSTQDILADVSTKFASYADSASKTALAQQLFGKSGAELIPLLNQLGEQGFAKAREEAEKYGQVISGDMAKQSEEFNDNLTKLKMETEGFANSVTAQLLPSLVKLSDAFVKGGEAQNQYGGSATVVANALKGLVLGLLAAKETISGLVTVVLGLGDVIGAAGDLFNGFAKAVGNDLTAVGEAMRGNFDAARTALDSAGTNLAGGWEKASTRVRAAWSAVSTGVGDAVANTRAAYNDLFGTFANVSAGATTSASALGKVNAPLLANADAAKAAADAQNKYADALDKAAQFLSQLQGSLSPVDEAYEKYVSTIIKSNQIQQDIIDTATKAGHAQEGYAQAVQFADSASKAANSRLTENLAALEKQADVVARLQEQYRDQTALIGLTDRERAIAEAVQKATDEWNKNTAAHLVNKQSLEDVQVTAAALAGSVYDLTKAADASRQAAADFERIWVDAGHSISDAFASWVVEGGSLMDSLVDIAKRVVEQIIAQFVQLQVIGPILSSIFGGGGSGYGGLVAGALGGGGASGGIIGSLFGGGGSNTGASFSTGSGGYQSLFTAGKTMWGGFQSGWQSFFQGTDAYTMGPPTAAGSTSSYYGGGYTSGFGQALGIAGGVYAGYNRYQQAGGGLGGIAGGAAYGYGTYIGGAAIATTAATGSLAAGLAAIPVVGWIALAAMVIDMASGGKLFGTKGKFNFGKQQAFVGPDGATVVAGYDVKGQQALFGGSTHSWHDMPVDQATQDAWNQFVKQLINGSGNLADQLGVEAGKVASGEFDVIFDKKGNVKSTSSIFNGVTYNEDQSAFQTREVAETMLNTLDNFSKGISAAVEQYRANADQLMAVTQSLAGAAVYIKQGGEFLALGSDQSLTALLSLAQGAQQFGETIDQTLQRIVQAQQQYDQFVAQFKAPTSYVDDFEGALSQINQQMLANIKQANALAIAAGAAGASEKDLANIHQYAAKQAAQLVQALEQSAQSLAFSLGLTTTGTLDQVNQEIASLQAKANQGAGAVQSFGNAMQDAAQRATDAMNLLIGDLSPLNDQQKLQTALQGLRAGSVTQEQVLEIGRRLYASSQAYVNLFNTVQALSRNGSGALGSVGGAGVGASGGLTGAERQRLSDLLAQQSQLQSAAQLQQYQTLAQQIAEIASFKGVDFREVLKERGIDIGKFEAGLQMSDKQTQDYIASIQKQTDSNGENTKSIVDALNKIIVLLGGTPDSTSDIQAPDHPLQPGDMRGGTPAPLPGSFGHSVHSRYEDGQELGRGFRDVILSTGPRGTRPGVPA